LLYWRKISVANSKERLRLDYNTIAARIEQSHVSGETDALTLYEVFEQVKDGRKKRGVRYRLALILTLIVLAKLAGGPV